MKSDINMDPLSLSISHMISYSMSFGFSASVDALAMWFIVVDQCMFVYISILTLILEDNE